MKITNQYNKILTEIENNLKNETLIETENLINSAQNLLQQYQKQYNLNPAPLNNLIDQYQNSISQKKTQAENLKNEILSLIQQNNLDNALTKLDLLNELNKKYSLNLSDWIRNTNNNIKTKLKETRQIQDQYNQLLNQIKSKLESEKLQNILELLNNARTFAEKNNLDTTSLSKLDSLYNEKLKNKMKEAEKLKNSISNHINPLQLEMALNELNTLKELNKNYSLNYHGWINNIQIKISKLKQKYSSLTQKYNVSLSEALALNDLENLLGKSIPKVDYVGIKTFGVAIKDGKIVGLGLYDKGLTTLPDSFGNLINLKELYLYMNQLTTLPEPILKLKNLQTLNLSWNQLKNLPDSFGNLQSLQKLYLYENELTTLPEPILKLKSLQTLSLEGNKLTTLPESFGNLQSLQELNLGGNELTTLPESFVNLKSLQTLGLGWNKLTTLPESFGILQSLQEFDLHWTKLTTLPEPIGNLKSLKELSLWGNQLTTLPESLCALPNLKTIWISMNLLGIQAKSVIERCKNKDIKIKNW